MSTAGIFTLITNDGKQDRMLMATELLKARLKRIMAARVSQGINPTPALADIEKSHIMFMNAHFKPFVALGYEYNKVKSGAGHPVLGGSVQFSIPQFGDFFHDMALHVVIRDPTPTGGTNPTYRWCQYPGERLCKRTTFSVNGNPLDEYFREDYNMYRKTKLTEDKTWGYNICMGQENVERVEVFQATMGVSPTNSRLHMHYSDGYQTPKNAAHGDLELFVPLKFWFNQDHHLSIPSVSIPHGQRYIEFEFGNMAELVALEARGNADNSSATLGAAIITTCELYINNIFVNPEIHDIYIKRIGFNLIRVHRRHVSRISVSSGEVLLNNFKWPIESFCVGFKPIENSLTTNANYDGSGNGINHLDHWHSFSRISRVLPSSVSNVLTTYTDDQGVSQDSTIKTMSVIAHGIPIYDDFPAKFYNGYLPYVRSKVTPKDKGIYMVNFNLNPDEYQPSGHINISRSREFYIKYDSADLTTPITSTSRVDVIANASAINFLLISDGSAVLRYST